MGISLAICIGATLMLITRQNVFDAETLLGERPDSDSSSESGTSAAPSESSESAEGSEATTTTEGTEPTDTSTSDNTDIEGGPYAEDEEIRTFDTGINEVVESEQFPESPEGSVIGAYRVTLHEQALNWSQKANIPNIGDIIRVKVLPGIVYLLEVTSKTQEEEPEWTVTITSNLTDRSGYATVSLLDGKMHIKIVDSTNNRTYILYYDREKGRDAANNDLYIVQEIDTSLDASPVYTPTSDPFNELPEAPDVIEPDYDDVLPPDSAQNTATPEEPNSVEQSQD